MKKVRKAIIPVAGMGTRFLPVTKAIPKEMLPIVDKPTIQYIVEEAIDSGIEEILFITSPYKKCIEDHFDRSYELENRLIKSGKEDKAREIEQISKMAKFYFIRQGEPLGSGHAISLAKSFVGDEPFAIMYGDDLMYSRNIPVLKQLVEVYEETGACVIGCKEVDMDLVSRYGVMSLNEDGTINTIIEKPKKEDAPSNLVGLGRYIITSEVFDYIDALPRIDGKEIQFTDAMMNMMKDYKYLPCEFVGTYYDTGSKDGYLKANIEYALRRDDLKDSVKDIINGLN